MTPRQMERCRAYEIAYVAGPRLLEFLVNGAARRDPDALRDHIVGLARRKPQAGWA